MTTSENEKSKGLYNKYRVVRTDGKRLKGGCIVLEFGDPIAQKAIVAWAETMRENGYNQVYEDVHYWLSRAACAN